MSFVAGIHTFRCTLSDADESRFEEVRVKVARHQQEEVRDMYARALAYLHFWRPNLELLNPPLSAHEPYLIGRDAVGTITEWGEVGSPDAKRLQHHVRTLRGTKFRVYFSEPSHIEQFLRGLRGSKENWIAEISFYLLDASVLAQLPDPPPSRVTWGMTISDGRVYLDTEQQHFTFSLLPLDMWSLFQESIQP